MSKGAWTPGPWQIKNEHESTIVVASVDGESFSDGRTTYTYDFICDAGADEYGDTVSPKTARANALLIAAAPDLYEALKLALYRLNDLTNDEDGAVEQALKLLPVIRAALAKAESRS